MGEASAALTASPLRLLSDLRILTDEMHEEAIFVALTCRELCAAVSARRPSDNAKVGPTGSRAVLTKLPSTQQQASAAVAAGLKRDLLLAAAAFGRLDVLKWCRDSLAPEDEFPICIAAAQHSQIQVIDLLTVLRPQLLRRLWTAPDESTLLCGELGPRDRLDFFEGLARTVFPSGVNVVGVNVAMNVNADLGWRIEDAAHARGLSEASVTEWADALCAIAWCYTTIDEEHFIETNHQELDSSRPFFPKFISNRQTRPNKWEQDDVGEVGVM